ncbi:MAG: TetR/AcrR family transcriptional regulator [Caulobacteraceae bacterium]|nr:TetR/AcrR family transcriptional regulator [Caulobacteraceae bacterium]
MPRVAGQIDRAKSGAILDAAAAVLCERGLSAPLDEIARRAGVSKQTIYNHYGSKAELMRALFQRRVGRVIAPLEGPDAEAFPEAALAAYARAILSALASEQSVAMIRLVVSSVPTAPELTRAAYEASIRPTRAGLAAFLERETRLGRLAVADAALAADFFTGMVLGHTQMRLLFGVPAPLDEDHIEAIAREAARRFVRAYG